MENIADKEELLKVFDENGKYTGGVEKRSVVHEKQLFHNEVALWILDIKNKKVLLERRSPNKKLYPNRLALCAGHVVENESIEESLYKEAKEELGLDLNNYNVKKLLTIKRCEPNNCCFSHQFYIKNYIPIESIIIQKEELSEVLYVDYYNLKQMVVDHSDEVIFLWESYKKVFEMLDKIFENSQN